MMFLVDLIREGIYIVQGYGTWLWNVMTGKTREIARQRLAICGECKYNRNGICELCGCILKAKARVDYPLNEDGKSIDGCPLEKW